MTDGLSVARFVDRMDDNEFLITFSIFRTFLQLVRAIQSLKNTIYQSHLPFFDEKRN